MGARTFLGLLKFLFCVLNPLVFQFKSYLTPNCVVHQLLAFPPPPSQYILSVHVIGALITRSQSLAILRNSLPFLQMSGHYRSYSFCIGMTTELANRGVPDANVLEIGRLNYIAFMAYIRPQSISSHFSTYPS